MLNCNNPDLYPRREQKLRNIIGPQSELSSWLIKSLKINLRTHKHQTEINILQLIIESQTLKTYWVTSISFKKKIKLKIKILQIFFIYEASTTKKWMLGIDSRHLKNQNLKFNINWSPLEEGGSTSKVDRQMKWSPQNSYWGS